MTSAIKIVTDLKRNRPSKIYWLVFLFILACLVSCAHQPSQLTLADLKSRYWQGTYYLSVSHSPTSIKCSISETYRAYSDVPVFYKGNDAQQVFTRDEDLRKIEDLQAQCFSKSRQIFDHQLN
jgi:hypothetical protein